MSLSRPYHADPAGKDSQVQVLNCLVSQIDYEHKKSYMATNKVIKKDDINYDTDQKDTDGYDLDQTNSAVYSHDEETSRELRGIIDSSCSCGCLKKLKKGPNNYDHAVDVVSSSRFDILQNGVNNLTERKEALRQKFNSTVTGQDPNGRYTHEFKVGTGDGELKICRESWAAVHGVTGYTLDALSKERKESVGSKSRILNDKSHSLRSIEEVNMALKNNNLKASRENVRDMILNGSDADRECFYWLDEFFHFAGDHMPNSKEIHLENQPLLALYDQYATEAFSKVEYSRWREIWEQLFPHVKLRVYKQVTGKCDTCALLTGLRSKFKHPDLKKLVTELHALHRSTYMGERDAYYRRRMEALENPDEVFSCITDGMAQNHSSLPYFANQVQLSPCCLNFSSH